MCSLDFVSDPKNASGLLFVAATELFASTSEIGSTGVCSPSLGAWPANHSSSSSLAVSPTACQLVNGLLTVWRGASPLAAGAAADGVDEVDDVDDVGTSQPLTFILRILLRL